MWFWMLLGFLTSPLLHRPRQLYRCVLSQRGAVPSLRRVEVKSDVTDFGNCSCPQPDSALQRDQVCFEKPPPSVHNTNTHNSRACLSTAETPTCLPVGIWLPQTQPSPLGLVLTFPYSVQGTTQARQLQPRRCEHNQHFHS